MKISRTITLIASVAALLFAACSNLDTDSKAQESGSSFTVRGSLTFGSESARSASFSSALTVDTVKVSAILLDEYENETATTVDGSINNEGGIITYSVKIPSAGTWKLRAVLLKAGSDNSLTETRIKGEKTITIIEGGENIFTNLNIPMIPDNDKSVAGAIDLTVSTEVTDITKVTWTWSDEAVDILDGIISDASTTKDFAEGTAKFTFNDIPWGSYQVKLSFQNGDGKTLYSCFENVTVFSGCTTDSWYGDSPYLKEQDDGTYKFVITQDSFNTFNHSELNIDATSTPYVLWNFATTELYGKEAGNSFPRKKFSKGVQFFSDVNDGMKINKSLAEVDTDIYTENFRFFFGKDICYLIDGQIFYASSLIKAYVPSYGEYKYKETENINPYSILSEIMEPAESESILCTYNNGYFWFMNMDSSNKYHLSRYDTETKTVISTEVTVEKVDNNYSLSMITVDFYKDEVDNVTNNTVKKYNLYYVQSNSYQFKDPVLYKVPFTVTESTSSISVDEEKSYTLSLPALYKEIDGDNPDEPDFYNYYGSLKVTDLQIVTDGTSKYLYVLVKNLRNSSNTFYTCDNPEVAEEGRTYTKAEEGILCNGGIVKIDVTDSELKPAAWKSNRAILGWYAKQPEQTYYHENYGEYLEAASTSTYITMQAPSNEQNNYLYGPNKFAAIKPKKLVIADDGGFQYMQDDILSFTPMNRIVTVDLENESLSAVDVDVSFSDSLGASGTSWFVSRN